MKRIWTVSSQTFDPCLRYINWSELNLINNLTNFLDRILFQQCILKVWISIQTCHYEGTNASSLAKEYLLFREHLMFCRQSCHSDINCLPQMSSVCGTKVPDQFPWTPSINDIMVLIQIRLKVRTLRKHLQKPPPPLKGECTSICQWHWNSVPQEWKTGPLEKL